MTAQARFKVSDSCKLVLRRGDITKWSIDGRTDAIVNAASEEMLGGGGVDGAIHRASGSELLAACRKLPEISPGVRCPTGSAVQTPGFRLPVAHIIHTVGPIFRRSEADECSKQLLNAYRNSLILAREKGINYIAFPALSCGVYGYPLGPAAKVALKAVKDNSEGFKEIHFVLFESTWDAFLKDAGTNFQKEEQ